MQLVHIILIEGLRFLPTQIEFQSQGKCRYSFSRTEYGFTKDFDNDILTKEHEDEKSEYKLQGIYSPHLLMISKNALKPLLITLDIYPLYCLNTSITNT